MKSQSKHFIGCIYSLQMDYVKLNKNSLNVDIIGQFVTPNRIAMEELKQVLLFNPCQFLIFSSRVQFDIIFVSVNVAGNSVAVHLSEGSLVRRFISPNVH